MATAAAEKKGFMYYFTTVNHKDIGKMYLLSASRRDGTSAQRSPVGSDGVLWCCLPQESNPCIEH